MKPIKFNERNLLKEFTLTIEYKVIETPKHKLLKKIGLWLATIGFKIYGIGEVNVEESD